LFSRKIAEYLRKRRLIKLNEKGYLIENGIRMILLNFDTNLAEKLAKEINRKWSVASNKRLYKEVPIVLRKLKERGYKLGVLTAGSTLSYNKILKRLGVKKYFDVVVGGRYYKCTKTR
jgi:phosphoglycolate phosphatase-like HAD superfamily hydrolase